MEVDTIILNGKLTKIDRSYDLDNSNHSMEINHTQILPYMEEVVKRGITIKEAMNYLKQFDESED